jgi:hypothetical protein
MVLRPPPACKRDTAPQAKEVPLPDDTDGWPGGELPEPPTQPHHAAWRQLCQRHPELRRLSRCPWAEPVPPDPLPEDLLRQLLGSLLHPRHRPLIVPVLARALAAEIAEAVVVAMQGRAAP